MNMSIANGFVIMIVAISGLMTAESLRKSVKVIDELNMVVLQHSIELNHLKDFTKEIAENQVNISTILEVTHEIPIDNIDNR